METEPGSREWKAPDGNVYAVSLSETDKPPNQERGWPRMWGLTFHGDAGYYATLLDGDYNGRTVSDLSEAEILAAYQSVTGDGA